MKFTGDSIPTENKQSKVNKIKLLGLACLERINYKKENNTNVFDENEITPKEDIYVLFLFIIFLN